MAEIRTHVPDDVLDAAREAAGPAGAALSRTGLVLLALCKFAGLPYERARTASGRRRPGSREAQA